MRLLGGLGWLAAFQIYGLNSLRFFSSPASFLSSIALSYSVFRTLIDPPPPCIPASISTPLHFSILFGFSFALSTHPCALGSPNVSLSFSTHSSTPLHVGPTYITLKSTTC